MPKLLTKMISVLFGASVLCATAVRCVQMFSYTNVSTGFIMRGAEKTIALFFILCAAIVLFSALLCRKNVYKNPFSKHKSRLVFYSCIFAAIAMFYDFVHQCINCYKYISENAHFEWNYFIPVCFVGISAVLCAFYFIIMGISFVTDKYDFRNLRYFHITPVCWNLFMLLSGLTRNDDGLYAEESILHYAVLIFGMLFYIAVIRCIDSDLRKLRIFCFLGFLYGALCIVLAVPRIAAIVFGADVYTVAFSASAYLFTGAFAVSLSAEALKDN
ncbi:MAG: hypothetical protein K2G22_01050 [Eubacterium sp.]|nr:hypothetical protein [Eubacterium sp.]